MSDTYAAWNNLLKKSEKDNLSLNLHYVVRRDEKEDITEIIQIHNLAEHIKEEIFTLKEVLEVMRIDKEK